MWKLRSILLLVLILTAALVFLVKADEEADSKAKPATDAKKDVAKTEGGADGDDDDEDDDEDDEEDEGSEPLPSSADITATYLFAGHGDNKYTLGDSVDLLLGFKNKGTKNFNVTQIVTSIRWPVNFDIYVQNFTTKFPNVVVRPSEETTLAFPFTPDALLDARDWGVVTEVLYRDEDNVNYSTVFVNTSITLLEADNPLDAQTFFAYVLGTAVASLLAFFAYKYYQNQSKGVRRSERRAAVERGTANLNSNDVDNDWLVGTAADPNKKGNEWLRKR